MAALTLRGVIKRFGETEVIKRVGFDVTDGEFVVFVGPSGCGKSTLLRLICGLESATEGDILIDGERVNEVPAARRGLALVFQSYALYPHMTVYQNMAFGLENLRTPRREIEARVAEAARMLQLEPYLQRRPTALSGGQRQRVAIGRAIVREPKIFLFDEPLSNLDAELRVSMRNELAQLHHRLGTTMIYVTHDQVEAMTMADKIVVLRAGAVEQVGSPLELYNEPANQFVAGFIGSPRMNFLDGRVAGPCAEGALVEVPGVGALHAPARLAAGAPVTLGIRPEHIRLGGASVNGGRRRGGECRAAWGAELCADGVAGADGAGSRADTIGVRAPGGGQSAAGGDPCVRRGGAGGASADFGGYDGRSAGVRPVRNASGIERTERGVVVRLDDGVRARISVLAPDVVRVLFLRPEGLRLDRTWTVPAHGADDVPWEGRDRMDESSWPAPAFSVQEGDGRAELRTDALAVGIEFAPFRLVWRLADGRVFAADRAAQPYLLGSGGAHAHAQVRDPADFYCGLGDKTGPLNLHGRRLRIAMQDSLGFDARSGDPLYKHWPFLLVRDAVSGTGYGVYYDNCARAEFDLGCERDNYYGAYRTYEARDGDLDYYMMLGPALGDVTRRFLWLTGRPALPPLWSLGFAQTAMAIADAPDAQARMEALIERCRTEEIPLGAFHFGSGYTMREGKRYVFTWNTEKYPGREGVDGAVP